METVEGGMDALSLQEVASQLSATRKVLETQRLLRESNLNTVRPGEDELKQLDSSIKRNSALTKKLRLLTEENKQTVVDDIRKTNQSKYVSEAVAALSEAPLRNSDVPAAVAVCSLLHQRYADFGPQMAAALAKAFPKPGGGTAAGGGAGDGGGGGSSAADREGAKRRRAALRLLGELLAAGVYNGAGPLLGVLKDLALPDYRRDRDAAVTCLTLLATFARSAREALLGQQPAAVLAAQAAVPQLPQAQSRELPCDVVAALSDVKRELEGLQGELEKRFVLPEAEAASVSKVLDRAFDSACLALAEDHRQLVALEAENAALVNTRGDLPAEAAAEYERRRKAYETLHRAVTALAEGLGVEVPALMAEDAFTRLGAADSAAGGKDAAVTSGSSGAPGDNEPAFEDPDTRAFYESLPEVRDLVPSLLLFGDSKDPRLAKAEQEAAVAAAAAQAEAGAEGGAAAAAEDGAGGAETQPAETAPPQAAAPAAAAAAAAADDSTTSDGAAAGTTAPDADSEPPADGADGSGAGGASGTGGGGGGGGDGGALDVILSRLSTCVSRDLADELAINFCYLNNKGNRRRLVRSLVEVPRSSLQLVPFCARIVAVLAQVFPDVPQGVIAHLESSFSQLLRRKDPTLTAASLEPRLRTARYLAELAKFRLLPAGTFFSALKQLLDDFAGHNIDTACALVESAGRFMYRCPETRTRMANMMEVMVRLKNARNLDQRQAALVESAYFAVKPPSKDSSRRRRRSPPHEYVRHLIFEQLSESTIPAVLRKLLKLPWADCEKYVVKCLLKVVRGRFSNIPLVSCLAAGLAQYHEGCGVALVDCVLEDVRAGLESPGAGMYQKRMADVRLLGELYNYMLCNSTPVFETLYLLLTFGHEGPELAERLDPPDDFFRVRLVCALLDSCGQYFGEGAARARLDRFLTFFQAYILSKAALPLDVEFDLQDVLHVLRPNLKRYDTYDEALAAVQDIIAREVAQFGAPLGTIGEEEGEGDERKGGSGERSGGSGGGGGGGEGAEDEDEDEDEGGSCPAGEARSLDEISGRSSGDERDERDEDFEREWQALMGETQSRVGGLSLAPGRPGAAPGSSAGAGAAAGEAPGQSGPGPLDGDGEGAGGSGGGSVTLRMLVKRGGKDDRTKELQVPLNAAVAVAVRQREAEEAREREEMKRLVLAANRQQEEEQTAVEGQQGGPGGRAGGRRGGPRASKYTGQLHMSVLDDLGSHYDTSYDPRVGIGAPASEQSGVGGGGRGSRGGGGGGGGRGRGRG